MSRLELNIDFIKAKQKRLRKSNLLSNFPLLFKISWPIVITISVVKTKFFQKVSAIIKFSFTKVREKEIKKEMKW